MACDTSTWWPFLHTLTNLRLHNFRLPKASPQTIFFFFLKFLPCSYDFPAYQCRSWLPHVTRDLQACNSPLPLPPSLPPLAPNTSFLLIKWLYIYTYIKGGFSVLPDFLQSHEILLLQIYEHIYYRRRRRRRATRACLLQGVLIVYLAIFWMVDYDQIHCTATLVVLQESCGCVLQECVCVCVCVFFFTCLLLFIVDYNQSAKLQLSKAFISFHKLAAAAAPNFFFFFFFLLLCTSLLTSSHL